MNSSRVEVHGVDFTHTRLVELFKLADAAKPFYEWVESQCMMVCNNKVGLQENLMAMSYSDIKKLLTRCYSLGDSRGVPALFDGAGKQYMHKKACYYFFSWMLRDAPVQRLKNLVTRAKANAKGTRNITRSLSPTETEVEILARLFVAYKQVIANFEWIAIREVVADRLEGSRRAIRGYQKEVVVRTALTAALQAYFAKHHNYGRFDSIKVSDTEIRVGTETFDVCVELFGVNGSLFERVLIPVKTRETEGGGHSHLFTRDINSAITAAKESKNPNWVAVFIIAENWSQREQDHVVKIADFAVALKINPGTFETVDEETQKQLNEFIEGILDGSRTRKSSQSTQ